MPVQKTQIHNLPSQPTPFIGREPEIAEIVNLLNDANCHLLTLLGPGGIGKTRLSIESISRLTINNFEHGVFYVPLASLTSANNIVTTIIGVLGIMIGDEATPQEELVKFLSRRNLLLVMDNFEHVLKGADLVADILNQAQDVKVLATSREALNLQIERVWHVRGMRYPDTEQLNNIEQYSALKLFINRAKRVRRDFSPVDEQASVIRICQLVDGIPLAIELAASWLKTLSCRDIIDEIEHGIDFLSTRTRDIPERHRSIRAVFDHSWGLLSADEQAVFPRLSVFRGGFRLEAAKNVADANLMTLSGLVEKSMVRRDADGHYDVHELLRQYADEKLNSAGETDDTICAYIAYFANFMRERAIDIKGRRQIAGLNEIEIDFDNVITAWYHAIEMINYLALDDMMEAITLFCDMRSHIQIAQTLLHDALEQLPDETDKVIWNRLKARHAQVWLVSETSSAAQRFQADVTQSFHEAKRFDDLQMIVLCDWLIGLTIKFQIDQSGQIETGKAILHLKNALENPHLVNNPYYKLRILRELIHAMLSSGADWGKIQSFNNELISLASDMGDQHAIGHALAYQEVQYDRMSNWNLNLQHIRKVIEHCNYVGDLKTVAVMKNFWAIYAFEGGEFSLAYDLAESAYNFATKVNFYETRGAVSIVMVALELITTEKLDDSWYSVFENYRLYGIILYWRHYSSWLQAFVAIYLENYEDSKYHLLEALKAFLKGYNRNSWIICLPIAVVIFNESDQKVMAVEFMSLILLQGQHMIGWSKQWNRFIILKDTLRDELGEESYQVAWERGAQRDLDDTIVELINYLSNEEESVTVEPVLQPLAEPLTERELEVLALIAEGLTNPQIGDKLFLSTGTVKVHTRNIYGKLNVSNRTEASTKARNLGLI